MTNGSLSKTANQKLNKIAILKLITTKLVDSLWVNNRSKYGLETKRTKRKQKNFCYITKERFLWNSS